MADYYNFQQVAQACGISETALTQLQGKGLLEPTVKGGRSFLSSQQVYRLRVAVRHARKDKIDLQEALKRVEERWSAQTIAP
jgi:DNA-binding transcriptional MerR regulator